MATSRSKKILLSIAGAAGLLLIWKFLSLVIGSELILPPPEQVAVETVRLLGSRGFGSALGLTLFRGIAGFGISCLAGLVVGIAAGLSPTIYQLLRPLLSTIKATPVMSVILLALIWFTTGTVPIFSAFLMAFPIITGNIIQGIREVDRNLLEMARVFRVRPRRVLFHLTIPSVFPYFLAGSSTALAITWKVVVAAEVLSQPINALGTGLYEAKVQLETAEVFAWTVAAILLSAVTERGFGLLMARFRRRKHGV
jgi:NitT/TauT family transport system permease protein